MFGITELSVNFDYRKFCQSPLADLFFSPTFNRTTTIKKPLKVLCTEHFVVYSIYQVTNVSKYEFL
jgi:hypothetical protein